MTVSTEAAGRRSSARAAEGATLALHIGLPKTATTFLQTGIFPALDGLTFLATPGTALFAGPSDADAGGRLMAAAMKRSAAIWRDRGDLLFSEMLGAREAWTPRDVLVSDEGIGRIASRPALLGEHIDAIGREAGRWGFSKVLVLAVFRRQDHWFASHYAQMSDRNPSASQADFERAARSVLSPFETRYRLGMLMDYAALHEVLTGTLGRDRVLMLPFERLAAAPDAFHRSIARFLGVPAPQFGGAVATADRNARSAGAGTWQVRPLRPAAGRMSRLRSLPQRLAAGRRERTITLTPDLSAAMLSAYRDSNTRLAAALGVDLAAFGYFPPGDPAPFVEEGRCDDG